MTAREELTAMFAPFLSGTTLEEAVSEAYALVLNEAADALEARVADVDVDTRTTWAGMDAAYLRHLAASPAAAPVPVKTADDETGEVIAQLAARARRVAESHQRFIDDSSDPGSEAFGAQHELTTFLAKVSAGEPMDVDYLSRFSVTPAEVHAFLAKHLAEDVHLRYQQAVGGRAASEAAKDIRMESNTTQAGTYYRNGMAFSADHIDPLKGGGPYPSELIRFGETGGAS